MSVCTRDLRMAGAVALAEQREKNAMFLKEVAGEEQAGTGTAGESFQRRGRQVADGHQSSSGSGDGLVVVFTLV